MGIIPARAGFTSLYQAARRGDSDHPRSRGVYATVIGSFFSESGSSPLARGLPGSIRTVHLQPWIIPARAGFTPSPATSPPPDTDHPRSRGVYVCRLSRHLRIWGSSPLARGLRKITYAEAACLRIIPARAGFTPIPIPGSVCSRDHPRSRGVYPHWGPRISATSGSSPLARGLQAADAQVVEIAGIIPARAGFTPHCGSPYPRGQDHPRSRGVYLRLPREENSSPGSSPLARGLPHPPGTNHGEPRIIPARAGFTGDSDDSRFLHGDHPRSRGVYPRERGG